MQLERMVGTVSWCGGHSLHAHALISAALFLCCFLVHVLSRQVVEEVMQLLKEGQPIPEHLLPAPKEEKKGKGGKDDGKGKKGKK